MQPEAKASKSHSFIHSRSNAAKYIRNLPTGKIKRMSGDSAAELFGVVAPGRDSMGGRDGFITDIEQANDVICLVRDGKVWGVAILTDLSPSSVGVYEVAIASSAPGGGRLLMQELRRVHSGKPLLARVRPADLKSTTLALEFCDFVCSGICWNLVRSNPPGMFPPALGFLKAEGKMVVPNIPQMIQHYDEAVVVFVKALRKVAA